MSLCRFAFCSFAWVICTCAVSADEGPGTVGVFVQPSRIPAVEGETAEVTIRLDISPDTDSTNTIGGGKPLFEITVSSGTITPDEFTVPIQSSVIKEIKCQYRVGPNPQPGPVTINVEGFQGVRLLGQYQAGTLQWRDGVQLALVSASSIEAGDPPPNNSPFQRTTNPINVDPETLGRWVGGALGAAIIGTILFVATRLGKSPNSNGSTPGGKNSTTSSNLPQPPPASTPPQTATNNLPPAPPGSPPPTPTANNNLPPVPPTSQQSPNQQTSSNNSTSQNTASPKSRPKLPQGIKLTATPDSLDGDGDRSHTIELRIEPDPADAPLVIEKAQFSSDAPGSFPKSSFVQWSNATNTMQVRIPWEWNDQKVTFTARVKLHGSNRSLTGQATVTLRGANPEIKVRNTTKLTRANGKEGAELRAQLFLFGVYQPKENIGFKKVTGKIRGTHVWPATPEHRQRMFGSQPWNNAKISGFGEIVFHWIPPFLLKRSERDKGEAVNLDIECTWIDGGPLKARADQLSRDKRQPDVKTNPTVHLIGCHAQHETITKSFVPLNNTLLDGKVRLLDEDGDPVNPGAVDSISREVKNPQLRHKVLHAAQWKVNCQVFDHSQERVADSWRGLPASPTFVSLGDEKTQQERDALIASIEKEAFSPQHQVHSFSPGTDVNGYLWNRSHSTALLVWTYQLKPQHTLTAGGFVAYRVVVDDGFGQTIQLRGFFRAVLGTLALEAGGPTTRVYEFIPRCLSVKYIPPTDYAVRKMRLQPIFEPAPPLDYYPDGDVTYHWQFILVDDLGRPVLPVGAPLKIPAPGPLKQEESHLVFGYSHESFEVFIRPDNGSIKRLHSAKIDNFETERREWERAGWVFYDDDARVRSGDLREALHALRPSARQVEEACPWLGLPQAEGWKDAALTLGIRVEMRVNDNLIAISDPLRASSEALPWNHQLRFILMAVRTRLEDSQGNPNANRRYQLRNKKGATVVDDKTDSLGLVEHPLPPAVLKEGLQLVLFRGDSNDVFWSTDLEIGALESANESSPTRDSVCDRLANLGYAPTDGTFTTEGRAIERFQYAYGLDIDGRHDRDLAKAVRAVHIKGSQRLGDRKPKRQD